MVFKCKMCGGDITPINGTNTGKCEYCKSIMTLPDLNNEKIVNLYNRANDLRLSNEFDKAYDIYEKILELDNNQLEAHWGLLLCKYGVEYVDDLKTSKKVPTCHRTLSASILKDNDFEIIKKKSYGDALKIYECEAKQIDEIQKKILTISKKEKPYDIFICYKETDDNGERTYDSVIAQDIYEKLINLGFKVFFARITLEEKLGQEYEPYIYSALKSSKVMLVVGTKEENFNAVWVKNEWNRYLEMIKNDKGKVLIPVFSKIDAYKLPEEFSMLQAQSMDKVGAMQDLIRGIKKIIEDYKNSDIKDLDEETVAKVQKVLEEAKNIGNGQYEVNIVKEKLPIWYYGLCIASIAFYSFFRLCLLTTINPISLITLEIYSLKVKGYIVALEIMYILILDTYFASLFINRKTHKLSKKIFPVLLAFPFFKFVFYLFANTIFCYGSCTLIRFLFCNILFFGADVISILISHFITPTWNLDTSSKSIMNLEEKNKQIEKNNFIRKNFKKKERNSENKFQKKVYIAIIIAFMIFCFITVIKEWKILPYMQSNQKDESVTQIQLKGYKKLYSDKNLESKVLLSLRAWDYYDIIDLEEINVDNKLKAYGFAKIKTRKNIVGYLYLGTKSSYYDIEYDNENLKDFKIICGVNDEACFNKFSFTNKRDENVQQVQITNEILNLREEHNINSPSLAILNHGDIFTVYDTYVQKIIEKKEHPEYNNIYSSHFLETIDKVVEKRNWYKIKTSNEIEGWICESTNGEIYLKKLEKK